MDLAYFPPLPLDRSLPDGWTLSIRDLTACTDKHPRHSHGNYKISTIIHGPWGQSLLKVEDLLDDLTEGSKMCTIWPCGCYLSIKNREMLTKFDTTIFFRQSYFVHHSRPLVTLRTAGLWPPREIPSWIRLHAEVSLAFQFDEYGTGRYRSCLQYAYHDIGEFIHFLHAAIVPNPPQTMTVVQFTRTAFILDRIFGHDVTLLVIAYLCDENRIV